jgi:hypothetical protein
VAGASTSCGSVHLEKHALERYQKLDAGDGEAAQAIVIRDEEVHPDLGRAGKLDGIRRPDASVASDLRVSAGGLAIEGDESGRLGETSSYRWWRASLPCSAGFTSTSPSVRVEVHSSSSRSSIRSRISVTRADFGPEPSRR